MNHLKNQELKDSAGARGRVVEVRGDDAVVELEQGGKVLMPVSSVREEGSGFVSALAFADAGVRGREAGTLETGTLEGEAVIPIVEETLEVGKRQRTTGGVRLTKTVHEREEVVEAPTVHEDVEVERVSIDRVVEAPVAVRQEGETTIYPVLEEVLVTEKRLVLKEEIRVTKRRYETNEPQRVTLRREEVNVEEIGTADEPVR
ncbi:MAG: YsnF/AvaK domain-containing protein [Deinococcota bacterium]|jgi:uncharacterized protein (TIGR02271 family)|nr:YsnF/AvaK domain-containing protein [Deinococcota bacterium]